MENAIYAAAMYVTHSCYCTLGTTVHKIIQVTMHEYAGEGEDDVCKNCMILLQFSSDAETPPHYSQLLLEVHVGI